MDALHLVRYLTLLDKYLLGCLFCVVLMACENFAISLVDVGDDDVKHKKIDDTLMLVWLGLWAAFNVAAVVAWWRAVRRNKPEWRLQQEREQQAAEAQALASEAALLQGKREFAAAARLYDEAVRRCPVEKPLLKKAMEHSRAELQHDHPTTAASRR